MKFTAALVLIGLVGTAGFAQSQEVCENTLLETAAIKTSSSHSCHAIWVSCVRACDRAFPNDPEGHASCRLDCLIDEQHCNDAHRD